MTRSFTSVGIRTAALAAGVWFTLVAPAKAQIAPVEDSGKRVYVNGDSPTPRHGSTISSRSASSVVSHAPPDKLDLIVQDAEPSGAQPGPRAGESRDHHGIGLEPSGNLEQGSRGVDAVDSWDGTTFRCRQFLPIPSRMWRAGRRYLKSLLGSGTTAIYRRRWQPITRASEPLICSAASRHIGKRRGTYRN